MTARAAPPGAPLAPGVVAAYLERIGHEPVTRPDVAALASLQDHHVRSVAFENLDIHLGQPLSLELDDLAAKVIDRRRGGFCYELNGLFCALLQSLGFRAWLVEARTREGDGTLGPRFDHARILVAPDEGLLLADVGTGVSPRGPIRLHDRPQPVGPLEFRVRSDGERFDSERADGDAWSADWSFDTHPRDLAEFEPRCRYHETSPESHFTHKPLATLVTTDGHVTLADRHLITVRHGERHEESVDDPLAVLAEVFAMDLPSWPG